MKKFTFKGVLDGFRSTVQTTQQRGDREIEETLRPSDFTLKKVSHEIRVKMSFVLRDFQVIFFKEILLIKEHKLCIWDILIRCKYGEDFFSSSYGNCIWCYLSKKTFSFCKKDIFKKKRENNVVLCLSMHVSSEI